MTRSEMLNSKKWCYRILKDGSVNVTRLETKPVGYFAPGKTTLIRWFSRYSNYNGCLCTEVWDITNIHITPIWRGKNPFPDEKFQYTNIWAGEVPNEEWLEIPNTDDRKGSFKEAHEFFMNLLCR
jgi:hypothetical protein